MGWISQHKITFLIVVVALVGVAMYLLSQSAPTPDQSLLTSVDDAGMPVEEGGDQEVVATLLTLHAVSLSAPIFQEPAFMTLKDLSTEIVAEPVGRPNPFAPIGLGISGGGAAAPYNSTIPATR